VLEFQTAGQSRHLSQRMVNEAELAGSAGYLLLILYSLSKWVHGIHNDAND
jgi:hypothetical protein